MFKSIRDLGKQLSGRKNVICPRCLTEQDVDANLDGQPCQGKVENEWGDPVDCGYIFPLLYIKSFGEAEPVPVQVFGWSNHGKTVFLNVMRLKLMGMRRVWGNYTYQPITRADIEIEEELRTKIRNGIMPHSTQLKSRTENEVYIMQLNHMMRWGSRFLIIMDHAGERFHIDKFGDLKIHEIPFLTNEKTTTLMMVSIPMLRGEKLATGFDPTINIGDDREETPEQKGGDYGRSMDQLLNIYIDAMTKYDVRDERNKSIFQRGRDMALKPLMGPRRKVVIVLTMADKFVHDLQPSIRDYLIEDNMWDRLYVHDTEPMSNQDIEAYLEKMLRMSNEIRDWLRNDIDKAPGGAQLVALLEKNNIEARYCIISATGHDGVHNPNLRDKKSAEQGIEISPRRVLDPLFWVMEFQDH